MRANITITLINHEWLVAYVDRYDKLHELNFDTYREAIKYLETVQLTSLLQHQEGM